MLQLRSQPNRPGGSGGESASADFPAVTALGVAWLNGRFSALVLDKGVVRRGWTSTAPVETKSDFAKALKEARRETAYEGSSVTVLLAHPRLAQHWVEVPSGRNPQLAKYLQRQVEQHKPFPQPAVWATQPTASHRNTPGAILNMLPRQVHDEIVSGVTSAGLNLAQIVPVTEVLRSQLVALGQAGTETFLVAAPAGDGTAIILARGDGSIQLARTLNEPWTRSADRVATEISRTLLFAQQQQGVPVSLAWLIGAGAETVGGAVESQTGVRVGLADGGDAEFFWNLSLLRFGLNHPVNLVSREVQEAPARRLLLRLTATTGVVAVVAAGVFAVWVHLLVAREQGNIRKLKQDVADLQEKHKSLQDVFRGIDRRERFVAEVGGEGVDPMPMWFLGYLSDVVPNDLMVTNVVVGTRTNGWDVKVAGVLQPAAIADGRGDTQALTEQLATSLGQGPFAVYFDQAGQAVAGSTARGDATTAYSLFVDRMRGAGLAQAAAARQFHLEGTIQ